MAGNVQPRGSEEARTDILQTAAECFTERGYAETSIDDVARRLGCTKGRIYHFFASKVDLFCSVGQMGMDQNEGAIRPHLGMDAPAAVRLYAMAKAHTLSMIENRPYQRSIWEGVEIHLKGSTTPEQRVRLAELQASRDRYADAFRGVMEAAKADGVLCYRDVGIAQQLMFVSLNSPIFWYSARAEQTEEDRRDLARQCADFAMRGLGADPKMLEGGQPG